jgi:hypothetical protein
MASRELTTYEDVLHALSKERSIEAKHLRFIRPDSLIAAAADPRPTGDLAAVVTCRRSSTARVGVAIPI